MLNEIELGDKILFQLLRQMKAKFGQNAMSEVSFYRLLIDKLPPTVTQILVPIADKTSIDKLTQFADKLFDSFDQWIHIISLQSFSDKTLKRL